MLFKHYSMKEYNRHIKVTLVNFSKVGNLASKSFTFWENWQFVSNLAQNNKNLLSHDPFEESFEIL